MKKAQSAKKLSFASGDEGERFLAKTFGGTSQKRMTTSKGTRFIDQYAKGIAHESKVGYKSLDKFIKKQVLKDAELLQKQKVKGVMWHFFESSVTGKKGPSKPLANLLTKSGIKFKIY